MIFTSTLFTGLYISGTNLPTQCLPVPLKPGLHSHLKSLVSGMSKQWAFLSQWISAVADSQGFQQSDLLACKKEKKKEKGIKINQRNIFRQVSSKYSTYTEVFSEWVDQKNEVSIPPPTL